MKQTLIKKALYGTKILIVGAVLGISLQFARAWTEPSTVFPGGNLDAPINISGVGQSKAAGLILNTGGALNGLLVQSGNTGIGTLTPKAKLHVMGVPVSGAQFTSTADAIVEDNSKATLQIMGDSGTSHLLLSDSDNQHWALNNWATTGPSNYLFTIGSKNSSSDGWDLGTINDWNNYFAIKNDGNVGIGTTTPNEQLEITKNFRLPKTTSSSVGVIYSGEKRFIHNYGYNNFFAGVNAGNFTMENGVSNVGIGAGVLNSNTEGDNNTAVGNGALSLNTAGYENTAIGNAALYKNTLGYDNSAIGKHALYNNTGGVGNVAVGEYALNNNQLGNYNTAVGAFALEQNGNDGTARGNNVAVGMRALQGNISGESNVAVGNDTLRSNVSGNGNTAIGHGANVAVDNLHNATAVGNSASVDASNKIRIGNDDVTWIGGHSVWQNTSDVRMKKDIENTDLGLDFINKLRPVSYKLKTGNDKTDYGFIAQEVDEILGGRNTNIVTTDNTSEKIKSMGYSELIAPLVKAVQEQQQQITDLKAQIGALKK